MPVNFTDIIDHLTTTGLAVAMLYIVWKQWQDDRTKHQIDTDARIERLTNAVSAMGTQISALTRIVYKHEQERN
jgi:hypothetical protein